MQTRVEMGEGDKGQSHAGDRPVAGFVANTASFVAASGGDALSKFAVSAMSLPQAVAMRSFFTIVFLAPVFLLAVRRGQPVFATNRVWLHLTRTMLHLSATYQAFVALQHIPLTTLTAILFAAPIFIALLAIPILGERLRPRQAFAIGLGVIGCMVIIRPSGDGDVLYMLLALGSSFSWSLSVTLLRKLTRTESHVTLLAWSNFPQLVVAALIAMFDWRAIDGMLLLVILGMSVTQVFGQWFSMTALRLAPAATVAPAQFTQILWATLFGALFFNEWPHPLIWVGAALIMASGYSLMRSPRSAV
ncbi:MAG: DMT family transporter [Rhizobiales bacterium]|nr:DMT family transporter [Hyphomicrobiales bacterium]